MGQKWCELDIKNKIAYFTAIAAFAIGWSLAVAGFILGDGDITDSVLWVLGQALVYCASVFGFGMYVGSEVRSMRRESRDMRREINAYLRGQESDANEDATPPSYNETE